MTFAIEGADAIGFEYRNVPIKAIQVLDVKSAKGSVIDRDVVIDGDELAGSDRFWTSLFARFGFNKAFFKYFSPEETFDRIALHNPNETLRVCVEKNTKSRSRVLAVSAPDRAIVGFDELYALLEDNGGEQVKYSNGVITSMQTPQRAMPDFDVADSAFRYQFCLSTPLDGYGAPNIYLALLRQVCGNGAVAMAPAFKSEVKLGKKDDDIMGQMLRAIDSFNNEEGFLALRQRLE